VADALETVVSALKARIDETGATVTFDPAALPVVCVERTALHLVLQNLLVNAMKFTRDGETPKITVSAERSAEMWRVRVTDRGVGIADEDRSRIFGAFERLHSQDVFRGTGLGLALAQRLVARHGGEIGVDSTLAEGSSFWFTLPEGPDDS
jgi:signal transduction histidine kinase